jgi:hypothetical protein
VSAGPASTEIAPQRSVRYTIAPSCCSAVNVVYAGYPKKIVAAHADQRVARRNLWYYADVVVALSTVMAMPRKAAAATAVVLAVGTAAIYYGIASFYEAL